MRIHSAARPALAALTLLLGGVLAAHTPAGQQDFHWTGRLAQGQRVEVKGVNGAIHAELSDGDEVEIRGVRREGRRGRAEDIRIERIMHDGGVTVCAVYPSSPRGPANRCTAGSEWNTNTQNQDARVEFVVRVPRGVHFLGATVNGDVDAQGMPADATVSTVNGSVTVSAAGTVEASTVNGAVDATMGRANPGRNLSFASVNGDITLRVPAAFRANVRASLLNGSIESDFPLTMHRQRYVGRRAEGEINGGGRSLRLQTVNGDIEIRRSGR